MCQQSQQPGDQEETSIHAWNPARVTVWKAGRTRSGPSVFADRHLSGVARRLIAAGCVQSSGGLNSIGPEHFMPTKAARRGAAAADLYRLRGSWRSDPGKTRTSVFCPFHGPVMRAPHKNSQNLTIGAHYEMGYVIPLHWANWSFAIVRSVAGFVTAWGVLCRLEPCG